MFNAEKLLGQVMMDMLGAGRGHRGSMRSLSSSLKSGQGLMTVIGLGVGAYEILKSKSGAASPPPLPSMGNGGGASAAAPPPPPLPPSSPLHVSPVNPLQDILPPVPTTPDDSLALRLIQVMIAASYADGRMDTGEEEKILGKLQGQGIGPEEKQFVLAEMHSPKTIEQLTAGITDPHVAQTMYSLALSAIVLDTPEERAWLDKLAEALTISESMRKFLEAEE